MIFKKRVRSTKTYDPGKTPVIHASICNGEQVAGFEDESGHFEEVMLIQDAADLQQFAEEYGIDPAKIIKKY